MDNKTLPAAANPSGAPKFAAPSPLTLAGMLAVVKPYNDKILAEARADRLERENAKLRAALEEAEDYFEDRSDVVDGADGRPSPNTEMQILSEIRQALGKAT